MMRPNLTRVDRKRVLRSTPTGPFQPEVKLEDYTREKVVRRNVDNDVAVLNCKLVLENIKRFLVYIVFFFCFVCSIIFL